MSVVYTCRHCQMAIGRIDQSHITEVQLGFHSLTPDERRDIISYDLEGNITVKVVCDFCKEALDIHPELSLLSNPLQ